jgi:hypothetical protein
MPALEHDLPSTDIQTRARRWCYAMRWLSSELAAAAIAAFISLDDWGGSISWALAMRSPSHGQLAIF